MFSHPEPPQFTCTVCERGSAHYSKPAAKHFPGRRRRRRMALVSPCPLGDVHHPTYLKIDAQDNEKCQMWQSRTLLCSKCEGMFLITFLPPTTFNPGELPHLKVFKEVRDICYGWTQKGKTNQRTFCSHVDCWIILWQSISWWPSEYSSPLRTGGSYCFTQNDLFVESNRNCLKFDQIYHMHGLGRKVITKCCFIPHRSWQQTGWRNHQDFK